LSVDGHACERWVLADWHGQGECLEVSQQSWKRILLQNLISFTKVA
jgi:hypothetical protein